MKTLPKLSLLLLLMLSTAASCGSSSALYNFSRPEQRNQIDYPEGWEGQRPFRFLVMGDTQNPKPHRRQNHTQRKAIYQRFMDALSDSLDRADMAFHVGDFVDIGGREAQWKKYFDDIFWDRLTPQQKTRFFPMPGNHDYKTHLFDYGGGDLAPYYGRFPHIDRNRYYFFVHGNACFVVMDSGRNGIAGLLGGERWQNGVEEQIAWLNEVVFPYLEQDARSGNIDSIFVFFHKPGYVTPDRLRNRQSAEILTRFENLNRRMGHRYRILSFTGHIHTFSHIYRDYNGDGRGGIDQLIIGAGGGTQVGGKVFRSVENLENLDLYRRYD